MSRDASDFKGFKRFRATVDRMFPTDTLIGAGRQFGLTIIGMFQGTGQLFVVCIVEMAEDTIGIKGIANETAHLN
jgi:hypothetical protein